MFGNRVQRLLLERPYSQLSIESKATIERRGIDAAPTSSAIYLGGGSETQHVSVTIEPVESAGPAAVAIS